MRIIKKIGSILLCMMLFVTISLLSIKTDALSDNIPPEWQNQGQTKTTIQPGEDIMFYAQGKDDVALKWAYLSTNETGIWQNITGEYGSPMDLISAPDEWIWTNFTWQNPDILNGTVVGWKIIYEDSGGNEITTDILSFTVEYNVLYPPEPSDGENILLDEDFEDGIMPPPGGWTTIDWNSHGKNWQIVDIDDIDVEVHSGDYAAAIKFDRTAMQEEQLISPEIDLTGAYSRVMLNFSVYSWTVVSGATVELHVKGDDFDNVIWDMIDDEDWVELEYRELTFDLSSYIGETIAITWFYTGIAGWNVGLDSILVSATSLPLPELVINALSSIVEGKQSNIIISADGSFIEQVQVEFNDMIYYTDIDGIITINAPQVEYDTNYLITARKEGFQSDIISITVLNRDEDKNQGWIFGIVYDASEKPIDKAGVCIIISNEEIGTTSECTATDELGRYNLFFPEGTYVVVASKQGYETNIERDITIKENIALEVNFILEEETEVSIEPSTDDKTLADNAIQTVIDAGNVGAKIIVTSEEPIVEYYSDDYGIKIEQKTDEISLTVDAVKDTKGTFFILFIAEEVFSNSEFIIKYDGMEIEKIPISYFLNPQDINEPGYVLLPTDEGNYVGVYVPDFSQHTITISSVIEALGGITAIIFYVLIATGAFVVFLIPTLTNFIRFRRYFQKGDNQKR